MFQSTHPRGVRRSAPAISRHGSDGFNPRTRVGCDDDAALLADAPQVSIHAPAWGATSGCRQPAGRILMFQSTHPRGVRPRPTSSPSSTSSFQSTHPRGVRLGRQRVPFAAVDVSIHAPAWGATRRRGTTSSSCRCFNPRTRVGCDPAAIPGCALLRRFQSTHPRGVRPLAT